MIFQMMRARPSAPQGVVQAHPLSPAAQALVEGALGDMHGSLTETTHPDNVNTLSNNSISIGGMSLSIHGLSTRATRCSEPMDLCRMLCRLVPHHCCASLIRVCTHLEGSNGSGHGACRQDGFPNGGRPAIHYERGVGHRRQQRRPGHAGR